MSAARDRSKVGAGVVWTRSLRMAVAAAIAVATMSTFGCAAGGDGQQVGPDGVMSQEQTAALAYGDIDVDEYHEGARRFIGCLTAMGYDVQVEEETFDLVNYGVPEAAVTAGDETTCYDAEFRAIDVQWQADHIETSETAALLAACLAEHGLDVPETIVEKDAALRANDIPLNDCM